jgi:hypothetical protein
MKIKVAIPMAEFVQADKTAAGFSAVLRKYRIDPSRKYKVGEANESEHIFLYQEERDLLPAHTEVEDDEHTD